MKNHFLLVFIFFILTACSKDDQPGALGQGSFTIISDQQSTTYSTNYGFYSEGGVIHLTSLNGPVVGIDAIDGVTMFDNFAPNGILVEGKYALTSAEVYLYSLAPDSIFLAGGFAEISANGSFLTITYSLKAMNGDSVYGDYNGIFRRLGN